ncbi:MAG: carbohydrate ABC transporter permease, partial [Mesorhizobium sp.]
MPMLKRAAFYLLVAAIVFIAVFPFYYAIVTSLKSGTELFEANLWPHTISLANYANVLTEGTFLRNLMNSLVVSGAVVLISLLLGVTAAYSLARIRFRGRSALMLAILSVSMFPQVAVLA